MFQTPNTTEEWLKHSKMFEEVWNFPHCVGAPRWQTHIDKSTA